MNELWEKLRDQEVIDVRLLLALPVLLVVAVVVYIVFGGGVGTTDGRSAPGLDEHTYVCHFDQTQVVADGEQLWKLEKAGDAIISRGAEIPTRVRCSSCSRMSCFRPDIKTGDPVAVNEAWDLSENAQAQVRDTNNANPRETMSRDPLPQRNVPGRGRR